MRRMAVTILLLTMIGAEPALACGDKFLLVGRGARYQRGYVSLHPGSVLLLANTPATSPRGLRVALKLAGHRVTVATSREEIRPALLKGRYDVLLADSSETTAMETDVASVTNRPTVIPVVGARVNPDKTASGKEFCILRTDNRQRHALAVLDDVLGSKLRGTPSKCEPSK